MGVGLFSLRGGGRSEVLEVGCSLGSLQPCAQTDRQTRSGPPPTGAESCLWRGALKGFAAAPLHVFDSNATLQRAESATGASICFWEELEPRV